MVVVFTAAFFFLYTYESNSKSDSCLHWLSLYNVNTLRNIEQFQHTTRHKETRRRINFY